MTEVTLIVSSPDGTSQIPLQGDRLTIGRSDLAAIAINDDGLSRLHASINRDGDRVWVLDEKSTNGSFVNGAPVPPVGVMLKNGDQISVGNQTTIQVLIGARPAAPSKSGATGRAATAAVSPEAFPPQSPAAAPAAASSSSSSSRLPLIASLVVIGLFLTVAVAVGAHAWKNWGDEDDNRNVRIARRSPRPDPEPTPEEETKPTPAPTAASAVTPAPTVSLSATPVTGQFPTQTGSHKLYVQMSKEEQMEFVEKSAQHISSMMSNRPYAFTPEVLQLIKGYVDGYARRVGNNSTRLWGEDLRFMFLRARTQYSPYIVRAFTAQRVPPVVGLYLCVIETEYHNIQSENFAGAAGLFQFIGPTAEAYGVPRSERTNVEKMAPAAAKYIAERMAEFGTDSMSVALGIAGYNRNPDSVRRDLRDILNSENKERSFWTLVANSNKLDHWFQGENVKYVPKYFAAAIVGEHPWAFGLEMKPLSTYTELPASPPPAPGPAVSAPAAATPAR